ARPIGRNRSGKDDFPDGLAIEDPRFCKFALLIQNRDKFLIELSITQFSEFFNLELIEKFTGFGGNFSIFEFRKKEKTTKKNLVVSVVLLYYGV
ncbi:MAG TPA: hypothetical protein VJI33_03735, partial [Candidatus Paceibacterota bacterium]